MDAEPTPPKVFLSHASEDKDRFVLRLAHQLRERGIDVWLDFWEILPGDSLVDKVFNEGLKSASAVIIVLSQFSVLKPWVREELDVSVVKRISKGMKIIPVVLDGCEVPEPLLATLYQRVDDLDDPHEAIERIVAAVYEHRPKPPLGPPPGYAVAEVVQVTGLNSLDCVVFKQSCEFLIKSDEYLVDPDAVLCEGSGLGISDSDLRDSLDVLENLFLIEVFHSSGSGFDSFQVTDHGWSIYYETFVPDFDRVVESTILAILNDGLMQTDEIANHLDVPHRYVDHIITMLEGAGHLMVSQAMGPCRYIGDVRGSLKRLVS